MKTPQSLLQPMIGANTSVDGTGNCTVAIAIPSLVFDDNCPGSSLSWVMAGATTASGNGQIGTYTFNKGTTTITYTVTDAAGRTKTDAMDVVVTDNEDPSVTAAADATANTSDDGTGDCTISAGITNATFGDNCPGSVLTWAMTGATVASGSGQVGTHVFSAGITTITYTVTDAAGLTSTDQMTVTVTDNENPTVNAGFDQMANTSDDGTGNCNVAIALAPVTFEDNCPGSTLTWVLTGATTGSGSGQLGSYTFNAGATTITYTVTDGAGRTASDNRVVSVLDIEHPTVSAASDIAANTSDDGTGNCTVTLGITDAVYSDNCSVSAFTWFMAGATTGSGSGQIGTYTFNAGLTTVSYVVFDGSGWSASDFMEVNVIDNEDPTVSAAATYQRTLRIRCR